MRREQALTATTATKSPKFMERSTICEENHYLEREHGKRFTTLMGQDRPDWRRRQERCNALNNEAFGYESWAVSSIGGLV